MLEEFAYLAMYAPLKGKMHQKLGTDIAIHNIQFSNASHFEHNFRTVILC